ncbi:helix-turn-helix transcriptional regulator [Hymenobacter sp. BT635]|uniref:Helix-turn-helix transcriptional regulator n=1 Tax=Hymenobacter nitidus TaxID=2880929 RepID=A0ABS8AJL6_9BACT|nr:helix-turn-helix transcriptional regulator [Hymenobacter nitidus]MCB2379445.1 helix-turn-helix transcriptional regulator [Hymenobacter nitidus]
MYQLLNPVIPRRIFRTFVNKQALFMVDRIRTLLQARQLTPTQFADAIGVARPIVSHILSGRNKPSLEVVQKIIGAFPDLSLPWLLSGTGSMMALSGSTAGVLPVAAPVAPVESTKAVETPVKRNPGATARVEVPAATPQPAETESVQSAVAEAVPPAPPIVPAAPVPALPTTVAALPEQQVAPSHIMNNTALAFAETGKKIRRIVIFYQDGTFSDYQPEVV